MKIALLQMDMRLADPEYNYMHAGEMIRSAMMLHCPATRSGKLPVQLPVQLSAPSASSDCPDVLLLPETWNVGFFPEENLEDLADAGGKRTCEMMSRLAQEYHVNIVAGSVAVSHRLPELPEENDGSIAGITDTAGITATTGITGTVGITNTVDITATTGITGTAGITDTADITGTADITNTAMIFDRTGARIAAYDKTHLFTNMHEEAYFTPGDRICTFELDGVRCGMVICYDIRFVEWVRKTALTGIDILFVSAQWPDRRLNHWRILNQARAIENQIFVAACNSCGHAGSTQYAGHSLVIDPLGEIVGECGEAEEILTIDMDLSSASGIRSSIPVFRDRRPDIY